MGKFKTYSGVILKVKNEFLLCKRSPDKSFPNEWSLPSGHIEDGESQLNAAYREFEEETNIELPKNLELVGLINKYKTDGTTKKGIVYVFLSDCDKKYIPDLELAKDGYEHTACKYFTKKTLPKSKNNRQLIKIINNL
jgi:ADP-ribose pyrophosphatase YjhB (NUDIX family)